MSALDRLKAHGPGLTLITAPFVYYGAFIRQALHPLEYPDSFAYLWRQAFSVHYLWGRSLTQRAIFTLAANHPPIIVAVQLSLYLVSALLVYLCLCQDRTPVWNAAIGALIAFCFASYTLNLSAVVISAEPVFTSLVITMPCLVALYRGPHRPALLLLFGTAYILAKNTAPYVYILFVLTWLVTQIKGTQTVKVLPHALLIALAVVRTGVTNRYDTSIHLNVLGNIYKRVFSNQESTAHFAQAYGMPVGPFVEQCKGAWVGDQCFGYPVWGVDPETRNYVLLEDEYGFTDWIVEQGQRSYLRYLMFESGVETWRHYREMIQWVSPQSARFMIEYIGAQLPENNPNNLDQIRQRSPGGDRGFMSFDPLAVLYVPLRLLGFSFPEIVLGYAILGLWLLFRVQYSKYLSLGVSALVSAPAMYFLTIYGASMEVVRHTFPAWILLLLGGVFYWIGIVDIGLAIVNRVRRARSDQPSCGGETS